MTNSLRAAALIACLAPAATAAAEGITFIHEGVAGGTLGRVPFDAAPFVITAYGDTDSRQQLQYVYWIEHALATIEIGGVGRLTFLSPTLTFANTYSGVAGVSRGNKGSDLFDGPWDPVFKGWDMLSAIGPVSGDGIVVQWGNDPLIETNGGTLILDTGDSPATFTAIIPAPGTAALGVVALAASRRRRV